MNENRFKLLGAIVGEGNHEKYGEANEEPYEAFSQEWLVMEGSTSGGGTLRAREHTAACLMLRVRKTPISSLLRFDTSRQNHSTYSY
jgi:hypothetical protein